MSFRIVVADDHGAILERVTALLQGEFEIVAAVRDGKSALECIQRHKPDIAVLDLAMPPPNGLEVTRMLKASGSKTAIVMLTAYRDPELAKAAIDAGASGYVIKARMVEDLVSAIRCAEEGRVFLSPGLALISK